MKQEKALLWTLAAINFIHIVDWASFYLCELNKADIMDIQIIDYLKGELAQF